MIPNVISVSRALSSTSCQYFFAQNKKSLTTFPNNNNRLPNIPRPRLSLCILADAADVDRAKQIELEYMTADDLKKCVCKKISLSRQIVLMLTIVPVRFS